MSDNVSGTSTDNLSTPLFDVVFYGNILDGFSVEHVKAGFAKLFKLSDQKIEQIFSSSRVVLKANVSEAVSEKFLQALKNVGAEVLVEAKNIAPKVELALEEIPEAAPTETVAEDTSADQAVTQYNEAVSREDIQPATADTAEANIYQAPEAELTHSASSDEYGSLERGIAGDYNFSVGGVISEAWALVSGNKMTVFVAFLLYCAAYVGIAMGAGLIFGVPMAFMGDSPLLIGVFAVVQQLVIMLVGMPLWLGLAMVGVKLSIGAPAPAGSLFGYFNRTLALFGTLLLMYLLILIGFILLVIPGIYLMIAYSQSMLLVADKGLSPWQALESSRKAVGHNWFGIFGVMIVLWFIVALSMIPLGIGLIWTMPLVLIAMGVIYRNMFGVSSVTVAE